MTRCFKTLLLLHFFICFCLCTSAQEAFVFTAIKDDPAQTENFTKSIRERYSKDSSSISGENKKYIAKIYKERVDNITDMFKDKELITSSETNNYLSRLVAEIFRNNPQLSQLGTRFLFSRAYWPNAFSTGEGTIVFNIGLFSKLDNESQVVFVLCHELAHLYLNHSNNSINTYINTLYSKEFQQKLKEINKQQYEKNKELDKLEKGFAFKSRRHSRDHESEADSMALQFMKNTSFDIKEALTGLSLLDTIDEDTYDTEGGLNNYF